MCGESQRGGKAGDKRGMWVRIGYRRPGFKDIALDTSHLVFLICKWRWKILVLLTSGEKGNNVTSEKSFWKISYMHVISSKVLLVIICPRSLVETYIWAIWIWKQPHFESHEISANKPNTQKNIWKHMNYLRIEKLRLREVQSWMV